MRTICGIVMLLALAASPTRADTPTFTTLDRQDDFSRIGVQVGFHKFDSPGDPLGIRTEVYGQYVFPGSSGGLYGQFPLSHLVIDNAENETGVQNLELGGFLLLGTPGRLFVLRGGLSLPTASDSGGGFVANVATGWERVTDVPGMLPDSTFLRLSFSPMLASGMILFRGDVGLDVRIADDDPTEDNDLFGHFNAGVGILIDSWAILLELANLAALDDPGSNDYFHTLSIGGRLLGRTQLHFSLGLALDDNAPNDLLIFSIGLQGVSL